MTTIRAVPPYDIASDTSRLARTLRRAVVEIRSPAGGGAGIICADADPTPMKTVVVKAKAFKADDAINASKG